MKKLLFKYNILIIVTLISSISGFSQKTYLGVRIGVEDVNFHSLTKSIVLNGNGSIEASLKKFGEAQSLLGIDVIHQTPSQFFLFGGIFGEGFGQKKEIELKGGQAGIIEGETNLWRLKVGVGYDLLKNEYLMIGPSFSLSMKGGKDTSLEEIDENVKSNRAQNLLTNYNFGDISFEFQLGYFKESWGITFTPGYSYSFQNEIGLNTLRPDFTIGIYFL